MVHLLDATTPDAGQVVGIIIVGLIILAAFAVILGSWRR